MPQRPPKLLAYFEKGMKAMNAQDHEGAAEWFAAIVDITPADKEALELYEKCRMVHAQKGLTFFKRLLYSLLGNLLYSFGMKKQAVYYLGVLSMDKPHDPQLAAKYGNSLLASSQSALASLAFRRALQFRPNDKAILKAAGPAFEKIEDAPAAIDVYHRLSKLEPLKGEWSVKVKNLSANHYGESGGITNLKDRRAEEEKKALQQQTVEGKEERIRELLDLYNSDREANKGVLCEIGRLLVQIEKFDQALAIWGRVLEGLKSAGTDEDKPDLDDRQVEEALHMTALCNEKKERFDKAEEGYETLLQKFPTDTRYCDCLYAVRLKVLENRIAAEPDNPQLLEEKKKLRVDYLENKAGILSGLVEKRAGDPDLLLAYGKVLTEKGDLDEAIPVIQKASQNPARAFPALRQLGWLFIEKGQIPLAIDTLKRALEKAPPSRSPSSDVKDIWYGLGECYFRQGDKVNAREWWKNIYECDIEFRDIRERYEGLMA